MYIEPGASARDDDHPEFRRMVAEATSAERPFDVIVVHSLSRFFRMVAEATSAERPFDVIVVHSLSRFFRDEALGELYVRRLRRHKVELSR